MYCNDASLMIVTKSLYRTAPPFLYLMSVPDDIAGGAEHLYGLLVGVAVQAAPIHLHNLIVHFHHTRPKKSQLIMNTTAWALCVMDLEN